MKRIPTSVLGSTLLLTSLLFGAGVRCSSPDIDEADPSLEPTSEAEQAASGTPRSPGPKNVILMISDGMGFNTSLAASYYRFGWAEGQVYQGFPVRFAVSTWSAGETINAQPGSHCYYPGYDPALAWSDFEYVKQCYTDSASAATAIACGEKTYNAAIGVDLSGAPIQNVREAAEEAGKATGIVTSVQLSHATPGAFGAHYIDRNRAIEIAKRMILESDADVIMGAGHPMYTNDGVRRPAIYNPDYVGGLPTWTNLTDQDPTNGPGADADRDGILDPWTLIETKEAFQELISGPTPKRVLGVAQVYGTLQNRRGGNTLADPYVVPLNTNVPNLAEMTLGALNVLDEDPDGLFLMVEGGAVDWAAELNQSGRVIEEQIDFDKAVEAVVDWVEANSNWGETLLIVTADHETGYLFGPSTPATWAPLINNGAGKLPGMQWNTYDKHTNSLVPLFAKGDDARWLRGYVAGTDPVYGKYIDNTNIADVLFQVMDQ